MIRLRQELREMGGLFARNPGLLFAALFVLGLAISSGVKCLGGDDIVLAGTIHASRVMRISRLDAVWRGARVNRSFLHYVAYPKPAKPAKAPAKAPAKPVAPRAKTSSGGSARVSCKGLSDLRFPEFNLLTPLL
jgi:hypothetical protein